MEHKTILVLVILIIIFGILAAAAGIFYRDDSASFEHQSVRNQTVQIYGKGLYKHMSEDVAIQGIAQDYITLFAAIPLLIIALIGFLRRSVRSHFLLSGILFYFFVTYLFYLTMGMYNIMFLVYVVLLGSSFFALANTLRQFEPIRFSHYFSERTPVKQTGFFLMINAVFVGLMWLGEVVPPLIDGTIYPKGLQHYTTLIVQGLDLALLLPLAFLGGLMLCRRKTLGYLIATPYIIFLAVLMTALSAKITAMAMNGVNVIPAVFIIPLFNLAAVYFSFSMLKNIKF